MRKTCALIVSLFLGGSLAAAASGPRADAGRADRIERRLDTLAASFAKALGERGFRKAVQRAIASSEAGDSIRLRDLLDREVAPGSTVARRLAERLGRARDKAVAEPREAVLRFLANTPEVDVSVQPSLEAWDAAAEIPLVVYTWEGAGGEPLDKVRAFDAAGSDLVLDLRQPLHRPVVVLEVHDTRNAVETVSRATPPSAGGGGPAAISEKLYFECTDQATYSSYPLIVNSSIWDAHEGCCNGPQGFLYFSAAGSEKTGTLPSSLGGRSGWSTNVWASNFQGPVRVSNTRDQWEWTADGWLQYSYRTYPAAYCRQSAGSTSGLSLAAYTIKEDDEWPNADDYVGKVQIDHRYCKSDVFDLGLASGWTAQHTTAGVDDVINTIYEIYCSTSYQCYATAECPDGRLISCAGSGSCGWGSCQAGEDYVQCGSTYKDCSSTPPCPNGQIICDPA
ncbi:MAG TPA: hypothetical protein VGG03_22135 [Thermoanaerobaculia bacterium]|jgi:hypothetical protein